MKHAFLEPIKVGQQELKNRVVYLGMAKSYSGFDGVVQRQDVSYIKSIAKGGVGLFVTGAMVVDDQMPGCLPMAPALYADKFVPGVKMLADAAHENGTKILFQLWHGGCLDYSGMTQPKSINEYTHEDIKRIQDCFVAAAKRAIAAGADGIEFQMCHTYLANQFLSPLWNQRTDEYGIDTLENQTRFSVECLKALREAIGPDKILSVKLQGFDYPKGEGFNGNDGLQPEDAVKFAPIVEACGVDTITISAGGTLTGKEDIMSGGVNRTEGWKVPVAAMVKKVVSIPVVATGTIRHPAFADEIINNGSCDMIGMARGLFAEREWVNKCAEGREDELRYCISCRNCNNGLVPMFAPDQSGCSVNPFAGREGSQHPLKVNGNGRKVVIVGAGPAGLEAAVTLKQRGFEPIVFEKENRLGGNINIAKKPPMKGRFHWAITYYENMVKKLGIEVRLGTEATKENILDLEPYSILFASGSLVTTPPIEGLAQAKTIQSRDILDQDMKFDGKKIVVIGGGISGMETAMYLKEQGNHVELVDFAPPFPTSMTDPRYMFEADMEQKCCREMGVLLHYENKVVKYADDKLVIEDANTGKQTALDVDIIVLATGVKSNNALYNELIAAGHPSVWKTGDANVTGKIVKAVQNGSKFAFGLN